MEKEDRLLGSSYMALALQTEVQAVNGCQTREDARALMFAAIDRLAGETRSSKMFIGSDLKLVVLPEYFMTSYPAGESIAAWADKACIEMDGAEYVALGKIAQDNDLYLAGNAYELDPHFDGLYFQTCFIIAPSGETILRYRRLNSMFAPTPHDVWDKYLEIYGIDGVFPVVDTDIGRLAALASEEILYPEIARALAMRGAEIIVHSTGEMGMMSETPKAICRKARAVENMVYMVSANCGGISGHALPTSATDGRSSIVDYQGRTLVEAGWGQTMTAHTIIDLNALRKYRRRPSMGNLLSRQRFEIFAETYAEHGSQTANSMLDKNGNVQVPDRKHFLDAQAKSIKELVDKGII
ncbi:MAG: hypothetical protein L3J05_03495 [Robiginitomaculum sp.]|nr:hypothetical protein [Robiginitomaculum sp.]